MMINFEMFLAFFVGLLPTVITSMMVYYMQRRQKQRDAEIDARAEARKKESLLSLELQMSTAKLSYAVAMAVKRGNPNGEIEEAVEAYEKAKAAYLAFLNKQATEHLYKEVTR